MRLTSSLLLICVSIACVAQVRSEEFTFLKHLESIEAYEEGLVYLSWNERYHTSNDTLHFYRGKFNYYLKNRFESVRHFNQVSTSSMEYWNAAGFYSGLQYAYLGDYDSAAYCFEKTILQEPVLVELRKLELSGVALLSRDFERFREISDQYDLNFYQLKQNQDALLYVSDQFRKRNKKLPLIAGALSAVIPGAGKYYLGKFGQGTLSLVTNTILGLQAYEGYRRNGFKSPTFIIFGSLFSVFYVANIWGSVVAVRVDRTDFNETQDETILLHMHIPVRVLLR